MRVPLAGRTRCYDVDGVVQVVVRGQVLGLAHIGGAAGLSECLDQLDFECAHLRRVAAVGQQQIRLILGQQDETLGPAAIGFSGLKPEKSGIKGLREHGAHALFDAVDALAGHALHDVGHLAGAVEFFKEAVGQAVAQGELFQHRGHAAHVLAHGIVGAVRNEAFQELEDADLGLGSHAAPQSSLTTTGAASAQSSQAIGFGRDSDKQSSVTQSGINTQNIVIGDAAAQQQLTGNSVAQTLAAVRTDITTDNAAAHSGRLNNRFEQDKVQKELDVQREVTQNFSRNVQSAKDTINKKMDSLKQQRDNGQLSEAEYQRQAGNWQKLSTGLSAVAAGLAAPTDSALGIAAAAANPTVSYHIGQHFKQA